MQFGQAWSKTPGRSVPGLPLAAAFVGLALAGIALRAIETRQIDTLSQRSLAAASLARASHAVGMAPYAVLSILEYDDSIEAGRQAPVVFLDAVRKAGSSLDEAARLAPDKAAQIQDFKRRFEELAEKANPALAIGNTTPGLTRGAALSMLSTRPEGVSEGIWRQALDDGGLFLDAHGRKAAELDWTPGQLFDVGRGLIWNLRGERVLAVGTHGVRLRDGLVLHRRR